VVPYTKGNVVKTVIIMAVYMIPVLYFASMVAPIQTAAYAKMGQFTAEIGGGAMMGSFDMGGDPLGFVILNILKLFGFSI